MVRRSIDPGSSRTGRPRASAWPGRLLAGIACSAAAVLPVGCALSGRATLAPEEARAADPGSGGGASPRPVQVSGELVCLAEEMEHRHGADVPPVHEHIPGFRTGPGEDAGGRYYVLLRNADSEALFADERFGEHRLILTGRVFPEVPLLQVTSVRWVHDGTVFEPYYWCDVCAIRGADPGACACCQGEVELREEEIGPVDGAGGG